MTECTFQNMHPITLPTDFPPPKHDETDAATATAIYLTSLSEETCLVLKILASIAGVLNDRQGLVAPSSFHLLFAAFMIVLARQTGDQQLTVTSSTKSPQGLSLIQTAFEENDTFWTILQKIQHSVYASEATKNIPAELTRVAFCDVTDRPFHESLPASQLAILACCRDKEASHPRVSLCVHYDATLFSPRRITFLVDQLCVLLANVASSPSTGVTRISILTDSQRAVLPDPTANLDWCGWKGAIPEIFSSNARKFPDRRCVIQSISQDAQQVYTYGQMLRATNVVAHHLLAGGIQYGDIVMIYAHRSVDLLVAVMAVLKAGATFSVIGKSYLSLSQEANSMSHFRSCLPPSTPDHVSTGRKAPRTCSITWCGKARPDSRRLPTSPFVE